MRYINLVTFPFKWLKYLLNKNKFTQEMQDQENELRKLAEKGDKEFQLQLGTTCYAKKDYKEAFYWYKKAAEQKFSEAQFYLGVMYRAGVGVSKNLEKTIYWLEKAAEQDHIEAQFLLGGMYGSGTGAVINFEKGVYWYKKAAEQGDARAQACLNQLY